MNAYFYTALGNFHLFRNNRQKSMTYYEKAFNCNTKNIFVIYTLGLMKLKENEPKIALELLTRAGTLNSEKLLKKSKNLNIIFDKSIPLAISSCYWQLKNLKDAINILEELRLRYDYVTPNTLTTLGYFYFLDDNLEEAKKFSNMALEDNAEFFSAWDNLGQIHFKNKNYKKSREMFEKSLSINENSVDSLYHLGLLEELNNNTKKALSLYRKAKTCDMNALNTVDMKTLEEKINSLNA